MRHLSKLMAVAGLALFTGGSAIAQDLNVRIGVGEPGWRERRVVREARPVAERRVIERRRIVREPRRTVCRTVVRERVRPGGVVVRRPTEVCRTVVGGRRVYID